MSIFCEHKDFLVVSHQCFLTKLYKKITKDKECCTLKGNPKFFSICSPYKPLNNRKRKRFKDNYSENVSYVLNAFNKAHRIIIESVKCSCCVGGVDGCPKSAADEFYKESGIRPLGNMKGGNNSNFNTVAKIKEEEYVIPFHSEFFNYDVCELREHIKDSYDFIVLDPPWWNKFIRRKKAKDLAGGSYAMMWNCHLSKLPINEILKEDGLLAIWCTNAESHFNSLMMEVFPAWGLKYIATWFWMKVTIKGEPVTPFSPGNGKQPFERIIFAARNSSRHFPLPEDKRLLVSVPSSIHSHKPPLCDVIKPYIPSNPKCLEIFARYLLPNWTSYGNEVLKLQHISFFIDAENQSSLNHL